VFPRPGDLLARRLTPCREQIMEKMKLDLDTLQVDGFATVAGKTVSVGTVRGNEATVYTRCTTDCTDITSCGNPCP
jgi:hypothetical protein